MIVRPKGIYGTPHQVATELGVGTRYYPNPRRKRTFDYNRDFFMVPVAPEHVTGAPPTFAALHNFLTRNKYGQRRLLQEAGIPVPRVASRPEEAEGLTGERFVVRPLRHARGIGYRVTQNRLDFVTGAEYISELYPKRREYRIIFVFGEPLIWLRKKPHEGCDETQPWGHENSTFQTINDVPTCRLSSTDCATRLSQVPAVGTAHIVAADILYNRDHQQPYTVLELNVCPSLSIDNNRAKVLEAIRARA